MLAKRRAFARAAHPQHPPRLAAPNNRADPRKYDVVVLERLELKAMTAKAPGRKPVNRGMGRMGHGFFARMIHYKADAAVEVDPAHTSRRCHACGHTEQANRPTRAVFKCRECGHRDHADLNAALNIRASGIGAARCRFRCRRVETTLHL